MESRKCTFCGTDMAVGTGKMFVKKDGTTQYFCSSKCQKNMELGRIPRRIEWTESYRKIKSQ